MNDDSTYVSSEKKEANHYVSGVKLNMLCVKISNLFRTAKAEIDTYLILFFISIGFDAAEAGLINGLRYLGGMVGTVLFGFVADRFRIHRSLAVGICVMSIITTFLQPFIGISYGDKHRFTCPFKENSTMKAGNLSANSPNNHNKLFYSIIFATVVHKAFDGSISSFVDSGTLQRLQASTENSEFGQQRFIGAIGAGLGGMSYSASVKYFPRGFISCETGIFIVYFLLLMCLGVSCHYLFKGLSVESRPDGKTDISGILYSAINNFDAMFFFSIVLMNGIMQVVFFNFLFLHLEELHASPLIFGVQTIVTALSGCVVYYYSHRIIKMFRGPINSICFTSFVWSIRFVCISYLKEPYIVLLVEIIHGFTYSLFASASLEHIKEISDPLILTAMCGIFNGLYTELPNLIGNILGGKLFKEFGGKILFAACSMMSAFIGMITFGYILVKLLCHRVKSEYVEIK